MGAYYETNDHFSHFSLYESPVKFLIQSGFFSSDQYFEILKNNQCQCQIDHYQYNDQFVHTIAV